jgi:hypothetical protein
MKNLSNNYQEISPNSPEEQEIKDILQNEDAQQDIMQKLKEYSLSDLEEELPWIENYLSDPVSKKVVITLIQKTIATKKTALNDALFAQDTSAIVSSTATKNASLLDEEYHTKTSSNPTIASNSIPEEDHNDQASDDSFSDEEDKEKSNESIKIDEKSLNTEIEESFGKSNQEDTIRQESKSEEEEEGINTTKENTIPLSPNSEKNNSSSSLLSSSNTDEEQPKTQNESSEEEYSSQESGNEAFDDDFATANSSSGSSSEIEENKEEKTLPLPSTSTKNEEVIFFNDIATFIADEVKKISSTLSANFFANPSDIDLQKMFTHVAQALACKNLKVIYMLSMKQIFSLKPIIVQKK